MANNVLLWKQIKLIFGLIRCSMDCPTKTLLYLLYSSQHCSISETLFQPPNGRPCRNSKCTKCYPLHISETHWDLFNSFKKPWRLTLGKLEVCRILWRLKEDMDPEFWAYQSWQLFHKAATPSSLRLGGISQSICWCLQTISVSTVHSLLKCFYLFTHLKIYRLTELQQQHRHRHL